MATSQPNFAARLQQVNQQINAELLTYVDSEIFTEVANAINAAQDEIRSGNATTETLLKITEATAVAKELLESATKLTAVQAAQTGAPAREAAAAARVTKATINRWSESAENVEISTGNVWWKPTTNDQEDKSSEDSAVDDAPASTDIAPAEGEQADNPQLSEEDPNPFS